jgi:LytS/YehU family sensor histidine kinase
MGPRLTFEIDVPAEMREARVPPMTVTTLVENAIKHGLSPLLEGGTVRIGAHRGGDALMINVVDTGQGFQANLGVGVGLANVRARLAMLYGAAAQLSLSQNAPRGVTATIVVPGRFAHAA